MLRYYLPALFGLLAVNSAPMLAQSTVPTPAPPALCAIRASVFSSYTPFASAEPAAREAASQADPNSSARSAFQRFDKETADVIALAPVGSEATLALVDLERVIDTADKCGERLGWGALMVAARPALYAALSRNRNTLVDPAYASRLLRSATAQAVLSDNGQGAVITKATLAKAEQDKAAAAQRQRDYAIAQAEYQRSEEDRKVREELIRTGWRSNASAPPAGSNFCNSYGVVDYAARAKDSGWLSMMDAEAVSGCERVSKKQDGSYYLGLAVGTDVTDEQLAHAVGKVFLCFANSPQRRYFNQAVAATRSMNDLFGLNAVGTGLKPGWTESVSASGNRTVTVECDIQFSMLGMDLTGMTKDVSESSGIDRKSFVQFELAGQRLLSVRLRTWIANIVSSKTDEDYFTKSRSTTTICDGNLAKAEGVGGEWQNSRWAVSRRLPYSFQNANGARRDGKWMVLNRGTLTADIWNVSYDAPVLGEYGNCYGGIVEHFVTLTADRAKKIRDGIPPAF